MEDSSGNGVVKMTLYRRQKFSKRLSHWKTRQDFLVRNITKCQDRIAMHKKKIEKYEEKLFEYESYMIVLNPVGDQIGQVRCDAASRLQEAIQEAENESDEDSDESDDESELLQDDDSHSVSTCDTVLEMRNTLNRRIGRK